MTIQEFLPIPDFNRLPINEQVEAAGVLKSMLQDVTPVRTGTLRAGWLVTPEFDGLRVENNVEYAQYVNDGTRFMDARNMTDNAFNMFDINTLFPEADEDTAFFDSLSSLSNEEFDQLTTTGIAELDSAVRQISRRVAESITQTQTAEPAPFRGGLRTLRTFNPAARGNALERAASASLSDEYGFVGERIAGVYRRPVLSVSVEKLLENL